MTVHRKLLRQVNVGERGSLEMVVEVGVEVPQMTWPSPCLAWCRFA